VRRLVVMEATGHYWQNLFAALVTEGLRSGTGNPPLPHGLCRFFRLFPSRF
jgi:hypothetical protein